MASLDEVGHDYAARKRSSQRAELVNRTGPGHGFGIDPNHHGSEMRLVTRYRRSSTNQIRIRLFDRERWEMACPSITSAFLSACSARMGVFSNVCKSRSWCPMWKGERREQNTHHSCLPSIIGR